MSQKLIQFLINKYENTSPDYIICDHQKPIIYRWYLIKRNGFFNIYLHNIVGSDEGRHLHDHPWFSMSVVLAGGFWEEKLNHVYYRRKGSLTLRSPWCKHRVNVWPGRRAWTFFVTGPKMRKWGFWVDGKFMPKDDYFKCLAAKNLVTSIKTGE